MLGQHTAEVLAEVLGWNAEKLDPLRSNGVI
jgi:crotonobetainyl-CoA:carnitine CoA-transferase CaiB-like acyl-CoA transferase